MSDISSEPSIPSTVFSNLSLGGTLGVSVTVAQLGAALYGVTTVQTFIYHQHRERDPKVLRYSIYLLWVIDSFQFICVCHLTYFYCVKNFGNLMGLNDLPWTWPVSFLISSWKVVSLSGISCAGVHDHVNNQRRSRYRLVRSPSVEALEKYMGGTPDWDNCGIDVRRDYDIKHRTLIAYSQIAQWPWYLGGISQTITYVTITIFLTAFLLRRKTGFGRTSSTINLIIMYSFGTCLITSATNIAMLVTVRGCCFMPIQG
ncbi:hypothetical protein BDW22DRAFT_435711 [Trametopsis cervina]|nr:hypothetical protein BDW22DRAFT_435711 [Trametopsis cervina]